MLNSFFIEALEEALNSDYENCCLISKEPLDRNYIKLECNHSFNYMPLYNEVKKQKLSLNKLNNTKLHLNQIQCPYCRDIQHKLVPYFPLSNVDKIIGVNAPESYTMLQNKCKYIFKKGKKKFQSCNNDCYLNYCKTHFIYNSKDISNIDINNINTINNINNIDNIDIDNVDIDNLKMTELKLIAKKLKLKNYSKLKKERLITFIKENKKN